MVKKLSNKLNDTFIKNIELPETERKFFDGKGLFLFVKNNGAKYWRLKYRFGGKEKTLSLGVYPEVSIKEAREATKEARLLLRDNQDPSALKQTKKQSFNTFFIDEQEAIMDYRQLEFYQELAKFLKRWVEKFDYDPRLIDMISEVLKNNALAS